MTDCRCATRSRLPGRRNSSAQNKRAADKINMLTPQSPLSRITVDNLCELRYFCLAIRS